MIYTLTQEKISLTVSSSGAEMQSLKLQGQEYLWQGNKEHWTGRSPLLFPIIGGLPNGHYTLRGKSYAMAGHGFAKSSEWELKEQTEKSLIFLLSSSQETREQYPFDFDLETEYKIEGNTLWVSFVLTNKSSGSMTFSLGGHPAFNCPLEENLSLEDYQIKFEKKETVHRRYKGKNLLTGEKELLLNESDTLPLSHGLFDRGALIMDELTSHVITLESPRGLRKVSMDFKGFPYLGIWKKAFTNAPFICLEPWYGVDSSEGDSGRWEEKEGLENLKEGEQFKASYKITLT
jgi:galactose mutarotase-like enzyme